MLLVPTAFSPNGDGLNDIFRIVDADNFEDIEMTVYDRWGEKIHYGVDADHGWDGVYKGKDQPIATYVYVIRATSIHNGVEYKLEGNFTLIR